jgi:hypothetical protein
VRPIWFAMIYFSDEPTRDQGEQDAVGGFEKRVASKVIGLSLMMLLNHSFLQKSEPFCDCLY